MTRLKPTVSVLPAPRNRFIGIMWKRRQARFRKLQQTEGMDFGRVLQARWPVAPYAKPLIINGNRETFEDVFLTEAMTRSGIERGSYDHADARRMDYTITERKGNKIYTDYLIKRALREFGK